MPTTRQTPDAPGRDGTETTSPQSTQAMDRPRPDRDVRARRPALGFLLRLDTARRLARVGSLMALDFAAIFGAILTALVLKAYLRDRWNFDRSLGEARNSFSFAYLIATLLFARSGLYAERAVRPGLAVIVGALFQTMVVTLIFALVQGEEFSSYYIFYGTLFFAVAYVSTARYVYERLTGWALKAAGYQRRAVLVGSGRHIDAVAHALTAGPHPAVSVVGFISLVPKPDNGLRSLGRIEDLDEILGEHRLDEVIIADYDFPQQEAVDLVARCHQRGVRVRVAPSTMEILIHRAEFVPGQTVPLFELKPPVFDGIDFAVKRAFDVTVASLLLLLLSPVLIASALAIKLSSRGPAIYRSIRPGMGGVPFACLKFRTMYRDADQQQVDLESLNEASGALFKIKDDPRMTPFGRLLRRFSLDELPQLLNVLRGDMSLVGPRPLPQRDFERLEEWHKKRYLVLPGITGLWQVSGRSDLDFDDLVRLDFLYLERWSVFLDLTILVKTVPAVFTRRGAF